jgi:hypothetical protein
LGQIFSVKSPVGLGVKSKPRLEIYPNKKRILACDTFAAIESRAQALQCLLFLC